MENDNLKAFISTIKSKQWIQKHFDLSSLSLLGGGGYGKVFALKMLNSEDAAPVAVKSLISNDEDIFYSFIKEISMLYALKNCPNVIRIRDTYLDSIDKEIFIIMEKAEMDLDHHIKKQMNGKLALNQILQIFTDITIALQYAHKKGMYHSDLKPQNILVFPIKRSENEDYQTIHVADKDIVYKITDWGAGAFRGNNNSTSLNSEEIGCTKGFVAPEILNPNSKKVFEKADIYSLAMTIVNICGVENKKFNFISTLTNEFKHKTEIEALLKIVEILYGSALSELLKPMLEYKYETRPNSTAVFEALKNFQSNSQNLPIIQHETRIDDINLLLHENAISQQLNFQADPKSNILSQLMLSLKNFYYDKEKYENVKSLFLKNLQIIQDTAQQANPFGQYLLGICFYQGDLGFPTNFNQALKLFMASAEQGVSEALLALGNYYRSVEKNYQKAFNAYKMASNDPSNDRALYYLGFCYENGYGVNQSEADAYKYYLKSANMGYPSSQLQIGVFFSKGMGGLLANQSESLKWLKMAADQGNKVAQYNVGMYFEKGQGVEKNLELANKYYAMAQAQGYMGNKQIKKDNNNKKSACCRIF